MKFKALSRVFCFAGLWFTDISELRVSIEGLFRIFAKYQRYYTPAKWSMYR